MSILLWCFGNTVEERLLDICLKNWPVTLEKELKVLLQMLSNTGKSIYIREQLPVLNKIVSYSTMKLLYLLE